jgi:hypothetical protein
MASVVARSSQDEQAAFLTDTAEVVEAGGNGGADLVVGGATFAEALPNELAESVARGCVTDGARKRDRAR